MTILVVYGTVEGHTAKIARTIASQIEDAGHRVVLADVREPGFAVPGTFDAVLLCSPIHMGRYPEKVVQFVESFKKGLQQKPSALITVSLAIASQYEDERKEAQGYPYLLGEATAWVPDMRHNAAGAIKYLEYNFFKRYAMRRIVDHAGGPIDSSNDYELTDWAKLNLFVRDFLAFAYKEGSG